MTLIPIANNLLFLLLGMAVLYFGAEWLVRGSARLASSLGVAPIAVGLTVVSLGTSAPELAVALLAAVEGTPDIALGNVMGSNLANIGLILGLTAMIRPLEIVARVVTREIPLMILITALLIPFILDLHLSRLDALMLLGILALYLLFVFRSAAVERPEILKEYEQFARESHHLEVRTRMVDAALVLAGSFGLFLGGKLIVDHASFVAEAVGIPPLLISLSLIAIGTSLPELATSLVAALRDECDLAVGNIIGSNIFNIAAILGITGTFKPLDVNPGVLTSQLPAVLLLSLLLWPVTKSGSHVRRAEGALLLAVYLVLMVWLFRVGLMS